MSVKFTAQQEMEVELAFEILGALGDFIDKLSDEIISKEENKLLHDIMLKNQCQVLFGTIRNNKISIKVN